MNRMESPLEQIARQSLLANAPREGDVIDENGFLRCGKCGELKQKDILLPGVPDMGIEAHSVRVGIPCACRREELARLQTAEETRKHNEAVERILRGGMTDAAYRQYTFEADDTPDSPIGKCCRKYAAAWTEMRQENIGMLLCGSVGTGKSYYACAIANALAQREIGIYVATMPDLVSRLRGFDDGREMLLAKISQIPLLVVDDLGAERGTDYAVEQVYAVIDARYRAHRPLIVTTNIPVEQMMQSDDLRYRRIFDRILEMCPVRLKLDGPSRREAGYASRRSLAMDLLRGVDASQQG